MNTSQVLAWLICLVLAFFAAILAVRSSYQATLVERRFAEVQQVGDQQQVLLGQIRDILQKIERRMEADGPPPPAPGGQAYEAAETAATQPTR